MGKKPIASVTYENERISIKNSLPLIKCGSHLSCVVHGPIYGRFTTENHLHGHGPHRRDQTFQKSFVGFKQGSLRSPRGRLVASLRREVTHILCKVSCFLLKSFHFRRLQKRQVFFPYKSLYFECYATMPMFADAHISSFSYLCLDWIRCRLHVMAAFLQFICE